MDTNKSINKRVSEEKMFAEIVWSVRFDERNRAWHECKPSSGQLNGFELWIHFDKNAGVCRYGLRAPDGYRSGSTLLWTNEIKTIKNILIQQAITHL